MRNPNGYGSVVKLSGNRRKPFAVRVTAGYDDSGKQIYRYLGYHETRKEAMYQLSLYNANPYNIDLKNLTLREIYNRYVDTKKDKVSKSTLTGYNLVYNHLKPLLNMKMRDIKTAQLQTLINSLIDNLSTGSIKIVKSLLNSLFKYAMSIEVVDKNYSEFIVMPKHKKVIRRKIFTEHEIATLWEYVDKINYVDTILILIYTGMRINELLPLKKENVDLSMRTIKSGIKTEASVDRIIPIHPKIFPLIEKRMKNKTKYLIPGKREKGYFSYSNYRIYVFSEIMKQLGMEHTIHDTRHTFATLITEVSQNKAAITGIIGHTDINMTEKYTHTNIEKMRREMEKIN